MGDILSSLEENGAERFGVSIISSFENLGIGILSKTDFEAYLFHQLTLVVDKSKVKTNYDWQRLLKITSTKLKALQNTRSARFLNLNIDNKENWILLFRELENSKIEIEDLKKGTIRFYISDLHIYNFIEQFVVVYQKSSVDYTLNKNQVVIKFNVFLELLAAIEKRAIELKIITDNKNSLIKTLAKDKSASTLNKNINSISDLWNGFKEKLKDKSFDKIAEETVGEILTAGISYIKNKIGQ
ncbi:MAG: hypothetical protein ACK4WD_08230 [Flavobacteriales bacterium]